MGSSKGDPPPSTVRNGQPYGRVVLTLKNQLLPEDKLQPTPSQLDGLDPDSEADLRIYGCELIQTAGILLKLPQVAMATGQVLLQRFYYSKSLVRHPVEHTAMACVCLASKIEEAPRRIRDVINVFTHIRQVNGNKPIQPVLLDQAYIHLKNLVIKAERRVLKELGFCVHIKHPHKIIVMYLQVLGFQTNAKLMQYSWNYMNDSLRTDVFVRYQPETVACACIYLTARKLRLPLPKSPPWYSIFGATEPEIRDICVRILKLYTRPKPDADMLEKRVDELCKKYHDQRQRNKGYSSTTNSGNSLDQLTSSNSPHNPSNAQLSNQKTTGAHNAWGGFISRSGSHVAPPVSSNINNDKRSRSRSPIDMSSSSSAVNNNTTNSSSGKRSSGRGRKKRDKRSRSRSGSPQHGKSRKRSRERYSTGSSKYDKHSTRDRSRDDKYKKSSKHDRDRRR